jgi:hypothetical protein
MNVILFVGIFLSSLILAILAFCFWIRSDSGQRWLDGDHKKPSNK